VQDKIPTCNERFLVSQSKIGAGFNRRTRNSQTGKADDSVKNKVRLELMNRIHERPWSGHKVNPIWGLNPN
jgi:hypothetical protein